jgi:hypothetical protein
MSIIVATFMTVALLQSCTAALPQLAHLRWPTLGIAHWLRRRAQLLHLARSESEDNSGDLQLCPVTYEPYSTDGSSDRAPVVLACGHSLSRTSANQVCVHRW